MRLLIFFAMLMSMSSYAFDEDEYVKNNTFLDANWWCNLGGTESCDVISVGNSKHYFMNSVSWTTGEYVISWFRNDNDYKNIVITGASYADSEAFRYLKKEDVEKVSFKLIQTEEGELDTASFFPLLSVASDPESMVLDFNSEKYVLKDVSIFESIKSPDAYGEVRFFNIERVEIMAADESVFCQSIHARKIKIFDGKNGILQPQGAVRYLCE